MSWSSLYSTYAVRCYVVVRASDNLTVKELWRYVEPFRHNTGSWQTWTNRRTDTCVALMHTSILYLTPFWHSCTPNRLTTLSVYCIGCY